jgi:hypothetical protein
MALFGLFRKEEKEILDRGLSKTRENVFSTAHQGCGREVEDR